MTTTVRTYSRSQLTAWRNGVFAIFAINGIALASWLARLPAIREALDVSTAQMGLIILGGSSGSILGLLLASRMLDRVGPKATILGAMTVNALAITGAGLSAGVLGSVPLVFVSLFAWGATMGLCDVAMNVEGAANERELGRTVMPLFHACFSLGTIIGAALGALAADRALAIEWNFAIAAVFILVSTVFAVRTFQPHGVVDEHGGSNVAPAESRWAIWREPRTLLIGLIVLGMAFTEGSANDWLTLAMVDDRDYDEATAALLFGLFTTAMTIGRIAGVPILDRFGRVPVLRASAALAALGLMLVIFVDHPAGTIVGIALWGLGAALGFPVGMSAAADDPAKAAARVSAVAIVGYVAFLIGPPVIGVLGDAVGLLNALLVVAVLIVVAGLASGAAKPLASAPAAPEADGTSSASD